VLKIREKKEETVRMKGKKVRKFELKNRKPQQKER